MPFKMAFELSICKCRGTSINQQVIIGTHGKLKSWQGKRMLGYRTMKILVLDEADEMLKVGPTTTSQINKLESKQLLIKLDKASESKQLLYQNQNFENCTMVKREERNGLAASSSGLICILVNQLQR